MELSGTKELVITNDALKYAKIITAPIENTFQRKRAYASIVALDAFADYLVTKDIVVNITKNLFKIAPINEEFEISDVYYNGWKIDVRLVVNDDFVSIPKSHFKFDILPDMYVAIKVDLSLENAELVGFVEGGNVNKAIDSGDYYLMNVESLSSVDELVLKLQDSKEISGQTLDHSAFSSLYMAYLDKDIDLMGRKSFIKHVSDCEECRSNLVEFYDFEAIVKNVAISPEIFEDHTLSILGGQAAIQEQYKGKEELIAINDSVELNNSSDSDDDDILGELFDNSQSNLLTENNPKSNNNDGLLSAGIVAAGALGAGAIIASATTANAATSVSTASINAGAAVISAGADLISSSKLLEDNDSLLDFKSDKEQLLEQEEDSDLFNNLDELDDIEKLEELDSIDLDSEFITPDVNLDETQIEEKDDCFCSESLDSIFSEDTSISPEEADIIETDLQEESSLLFTEIESVEPFLESEPVDFYEEDDLILLDAEKTIMVDEEDDDEFTKFLKEDLAFDEDDSSLEEIIDNEGDTPSEEKDSLAVLEDEKDVFVGNSSLDSKEELSDDDHLMSFTSQDDDFIQEEQDYSFEPSEQTEEEPLDEFKDFIRAGQDLQEEDEEGDIETLDNEIQLSYTSEEDEIEDSDNEVMPLYESGDENIEEGELESIEDDLEVLDSIEDEDSGDVEFLATILEEIDETEDNSDDGGGFLNSAYSQDEESENQELRTLYDGGNDVDSNEANDQIEYIINKDNGISIFKDKKMIILASCFVGCLFFGTVFGVTSANNKAKTAKENAELANQQLQQQMGEINQDLGTPIPMDASIPPTGEDLARGASAQAPRDMNKVMTNVFDENPSTVAVTKIAWEVPQSIATNELFSKYLQIAGKNLQLNLKNDLMNATEFAYNDKVKVLIIIGKDNNIKKLEVLNTSGSEQIDDLVLQSIKETLKYINVPQLPDSAVPGQHNLAKENAYNLKLVINF